MFDKQYHQDKGENFISLNKIFSNTLKIHIDDYCFVKYTLFLLINS